ncbi:hypothetical protein GJ496_007599 [Pomphorhynchus laevis]|nr:hypothetical protein GJ496_007599 [Pomphorhynchus laevis]
MDAIVQLEGVVIDSSGLRFVKLERHLENKNAIHSVSSYNCVECTNGIKEIVPNNGNIISLTDEDFEIYSPPNLLNTKSQYNSTEDPQAAKKFREEIVKWIEQKILVKWVEPVETGILSLMVIKQQTDRLTQFAFKSRAVTAAVAIDRDREALVRLDNLHHFGTERSYYLAKMVIPSVTRHHIEAIVRECMDCQSIDPDSIPHEHGTCCVDTNGHVCQSTGPSRYIVWKELTRENYVEVCERIMKVILTHGISIELLVDNSKTFRSNKVNSLCTKWGVQLIFRAAYRSQWNGIAKRYHRTVKRISEICNCSILKETFWYNLSLSTVNGISPSNATFKHYWRHPKSSANSTDQINNSDFQIGELLWVKPAEAKCTSRWLKGVVTNANSRSIIEVNGISRHKTYVRNIVETKSTIGDESESRSRVRDISYSFETDDNPRRIIR